MGVKIDQNLGSDYKEFLELLTKETQRLKKWIAKKEWSEEGMETGMELEGWLLTKDFIPTTNNLEFIEGLHHPQVVLEAAQSCWEINTDHYFLENHSLKQQEDNIHELLKLCQQQAEMENSKILYCGTLPTAEQGDFTRNQLTDSYRFVFLDDKFREMCDFEKVPINIYGQQGDSLHCLIDSIALIGALSSFQIHLKVPLKNALSFYNTAQMISAPMVAISCNSPSCFRHVLWAESRIPIYEQIFEFRKKRGACIRNRVYFGMDYVKNSIVDLFLENMYSQKVILPLLSSECIDNLFHLRLHNGTIYRWNRPVIGFDNDGAPHFRIEHRPLPAGPSVVDMCANVALFVGLMQYISTEKQPRLLDFSVVKNNFYQAAKYGLEARLSWLDNKTMEAQELLLKILLPLAAEGLNQLDLHQEESKIYLDVIKERIKTKQTGSNWQMKFLENNNNDYLALAKVYTEMQNTRLPVHEWAVPH